MNGDALQAGRDAHDRHVERRRQAADRARRIRDRDRRSSSPAAPVPDDRPEQLNTTVPHVLRARLKDEASSLGVSMSSLMTRVLAERYGRAS